MHGNWESPQNKALISSRISLKGTVRIYQESGILLGLQIDLMLLDDSFSVGFVTSHPTSATCVKVNHSQEKSQSLISLHFYNLRWHQCVMHACQSHVSVPNVGYHVHLAIRIMLLNTAILGMMRSVRGRKAVQCGYVLL
jgi:hypothetical protein